MIYWNMSCLMADPMTPPNLRRDVDAWLRGRGVSPYMLEACVHVAAHSEPRVAEHVVFVQSNGSPGRRLLLDYPDATEWEDLERCCIMETRDGKVVWVDALH